LARVAFRKGRGKVFWASADTGNRERGKIIVVQNPKSTSTAGTKIVVALTVLYIAAAIVAATQIIWHGEASTKAIEQILTTYSLKNEGEQAVDRYADQHPFLGFLFANPVKKELELPSHEESAKHLNSDIEDDMKTVRQESFVTAWWSWGFLSFSLLYVTTVIALQRSYSTRAVIFALTSVSVICFVIGIFAPAMVIWTSPHIPMASGDLEFVVQHQVRGIAAIIWDLLTGGHSIIGGFLLLFSILTPLTKATLTIFATACRSRDLNYKIGQFLHTIGKWSMADVFVAAILLSLYALKFQQATKSIPCLGLYYFIGYCLLSLGTTELLTRSGLVSTHHTEKAPRKIGGGVIGSLFAAVVCFAALTSAYTYQQYTLITHEKVSASSSPDKLDNRALVLPAHK
jgi:paraquat-inducible protein A